jgi:hypothetical protein
LEQDPASLVPHTLHLADGGLLRFTDNPRRHSVWRKLRSPHKPLPLPPLDVQGTVFDRRSFAAENVQKRKWFDLAKQLLSTDKPTKKLA